MTAGHEHDPSCGAAETDTAGVFAGERPRLLGLAYRMLGSLHDAEDVVQEAWIRWQRADHESIDNPAAWLTTVTTRLALDRTRSVARRREEYVGPWLPEPVALAADDPADVSERAESLTLGFLVVLDTLSAVERAVFLLAEVFDEPYATIAAAVGKSEVNCRQIASRARRKVRGARPPEVAPAGPEVLEALLAATVAGEIDRLLALLDTDVVAVSDGGRQHRAARRPVVGADRVARFLTNLAARAAGMAVELGSVNGEAVVVIRIPDGPLVVGADVAGDRVVAVRLLRNPAKLTHLADSVDLR